MPFKDEINIHICHFTESNGRHFATKKEVTFPLPRWVMFESLLPDIEICLQNKDNSCKMKWHIGEGGTSPLILDILQWALDTFGSQGMP